MVHALNLTRFIIKDSCLALDATPFLADAMVLAIGGFAHAQWAVRNSSLLLFGAILRRGTRFGDGSGKGVTCNEFFSINCHVTLFP